jgi:hypothetical protein
MRKYKPEELKVGKVYEDCGGLFKYIGRAYNTVDYEFVELIPDEDEDGNIIPDSFTESAFTRLLCSSELFFE